MSLSQSSKATDFFLSLMISLQQREQEGGRISHQKKK
jgi:hypothetical protein